MIDTKNLIATNPNVTYLHIDDIVSRFNVDIINDSHLLPSVVKLCQLWQVPYRYIAEYIISKNFTCDLFDYCLYSNSHSKMVAEKAYYRIREEQEKQVVYYNVYITENKFIGVKLLPRLVEYILEKFYPKFYLVKEEKVDIDINREETLNDVFYKYNDYGFTINDIIDIVNGNKIRRTNEFLIYDNGEILYLPLDNIIVCGSEYSISLSIPCEAIIQNDWSIVEDYNVHSIIKPDADINLGRNPNNFFTGKQKDFPYWNHSKIAQIRELFNK